MLSSTLHIIRTFLCIMGINYNLFQSWTFYLRKGIRLAEDMKFLIVTGVAGPPLFAYNSYNMIVSNFITFFWIMKIICISYLNIIIYQILIRLTSISKLIHTCINTYSQWINKELSSDFNLDNKSFILYSSNGNSMP